VKCQRAQPPLAAHCDACGQCVAGRSHHCSLFGTCIGAHNRRRYAALLCAVFVSLAPQLLRIALHLLTVALPGALRALAAGALLQLFLLAARTACVLLYALGVTGLLCGCLGLIWQQMVYAHYAAGTLADERAA
jgi:hypothetical protein